jgi:hypothetical protein
VILKDAFDNEIVPGVVVAYATTSSRSAIVKYGVVKEYKDFSPDAWVRGPFPFAVIVEGLDEYSLDTEEDLAKGLPASAIVSEETKWGSIRYIGWKDRRLTRLDNLLVLPHATRQYLIENCRRFVGWGNWQSLKEQVTV